MPRRVGRIVDEKKNRLREKISRIRFDSAGDQVASTTRPITNKVNGKTIFFFFLIFLRARPVIVRTKTALEHESAREARFNVQLN